jgi:hypothetical protein
MLKDFNVTLSAEEALIEAARAKARAEKTTLSEKFRRWLEDYAGGEETGGQELLARHLEAMEKLKGKVVIGRKLTRDELNER